MPRKKEYTAEFEAQAVKLVFEEIEPDESRTHACDRVGAAVVAASGDAHELGDGGVVVPDGQSNALSASRSHASVLAAAGHLMTANGHNFLAP